MRLKLLLIIVNTTQGIGDFWREVNDANASKAVVYNGYSKTTGRKLNKINILIKIRTKSRVGSSSTEISAPSEIMDGGKKLFFIILII